MQGFYNLTNKIRETLQLDAFVNTVTYGDIFEVDLNKQTIFPLSHVMISGATMQSNVWNFQVSVLCMDIVDESKEFPEGIPADFRGTSNEQDVLNTQLAVLNKLIMVLRKGDLHRDKYQLIGDPNCEPFYDRFDNELAGWTITMDILIYNDISIC